MSNFMIALLLGAGIGAWVYSKVMRSSGNNTKSALTVGGVTALLVFLLVLILLGIFL